jgi:hypothetical protein
MKQPPASALPASAIRIITRARERRWASNLQPRKLKEVAVAAKVYAEAWVLALGAANDEADRAERRAHRRLMSLTLEPDDREFAGWIDGLTAPRCATHPTTTKEPPQHDNKAASFPEQTL